MNKAILNPEVQLFIQEHLQEDLTKLILKGSSFEDVTVQELATQISGLKRAEKKLPTWFKTEGILFPPNLNLEQTSSEITAKYKSELLTGKVLVDLTGGFGIDDFYFSKSFNKVIHCELNNELSALASHNFQVLNAINVETFSGDGLSYIENSSEKIDWIYIDPARRGDHGGKVFLLEQCTPNVPLNLKLLFNRSENILIKTSPLLDLSLGIDELRKVVEVHIVAVNNEVKELLWILNRNISNEIKIKTVNITKQGTELLNGIFGEDQANIGFELPKNYLYEPNAAIMKSGLFKTLAEETETFKLHSNSHLFTSDQLMTFPGRSFEILQTLPYHKKTLKKALKLKKANITTRNFPRSVTEIRKELKLEDGGSDYLFFTTDLNEDKIVLVCKKVQI